MYDSKNTSRYRETVMEIKHLSNYYLKDISFSLKKEILGFAGLDLEQGEQTYKSNFWN